MFKLNQRNFTNAIAKKGLNPVDLAKKAGLSPATITRTLQTNAIYSYKALGKIASVLDVEPTSLIEFDTKK